MGYLSLPLRIEDGRMVRAKSVKQAIDDALSMLISTPLYSNPIDPSFGFVFMNLRFEQIDEKEGIVYDSAHDGLSPVLDEDIYNKKISGNSRNLNTFAAELKESILRVEQRIKDVKVSMTYLREERAIIVVVTGVIRETGEDYQFQKRIDIWN